MRFNCSEVWQSATGLRGVVTNIDDDGMKGHLVFENGEQAVLKYHGFTMPGHWQLAPSFTRPIKSAEELRAIVVQTAARHPAWPVSMNVAVRAKERPGSWGVDSVPPPGSHIAYADAAKHAANIAFAYSCLFDLAAT